MIKNKNSKDILAKILSEEDIVVIRTQAETASFDIVKRIMTLPIFKSKMSDTVETLFIAHEAAHAKYTIVESMEDCERIFRSLDFSILNIIEDNRIERMMKEKYPGLKPTFHAGYQELVQKEFFGKPSKFNKLPFIDRVNVYSKVGISSGITFSPEEQALFDRINSTTTFDECQELVAEAKAMTKSSLGKNINDILGKILDNNEKKHIQDKISNPKKISSSDEDADASLDGGTDIDYDHANISSDDKETSDNESQYSTNIKYDDYYSESDVEDIISKKLTIQKFNEKLHEFIDSDTTAINYSTEYTRNIFGNNFVSVDKFISGMKSNGIYLRDSESVLPEYQQFLKDSESYVNNMIKEFEMRKAADRYSRTAVSKSGELSMNKIYKHKISTNIFKQIEIVKSGKNHAVIMLVDWSGSMAHVMPDVLKQVVYLSMFCRRMNIPYEVIAFTDKNHNSKLSSEKVSATPDGIELLTYSVCHISMFSNRMTKSQFEDMTRICFMSYKMVGNNSSLTYRLSGTPLNSSLLSMNDFIYEYKKRNQIDKVSFILLSDGDSDAISSLLDSKYGKNVINTITDSITKNTYELKSDNNLVRNLFLQMIRDRNKTTNIVFYLSQDVYSNSSDNDFRRTLNNFECGGDDIQKAQKEYNQNLYYTTNNNKFLDKLIYMYTDVLKVNFKENINEINFKKSMEKRKTSKMILAEVIKSIA